MNKKKRLAFFMSLLAASCGAPDSRDNAPMPGVPGGTGGSADGGVSGGSGGKPAPGGNGGATGGSGAAGGLDGAAGAAGGAGGAAGGAGGAGGGAGGAAGAAGGAGGSGGAAAGAGGGGAGVPQNQAPQVTVAEASPTQIFVGTQVTLSANVSDDGMPGMLGLTWSKVSGPGSISFATPQAATTTASFSVPGAYAVRLTANDGALEGKADKQVTVLSVTTGLSSHFPLDENQGTSAGDKVAGNPAATTVNNMVWTQGKKGAAVNCTGLANTVSIPNSAATQFGAEENFTISLWIKSTMVVGPDRYPELVYKQVAGGRIELFLFKVSSAPELAFKLWEGTASSTVTADLPLDGNWHHVAARRTGNALSVSVDGTLKAQASLTVRLVTNTAPLLLCGIGDTWGQFVGAIDDLQIHKRALQDAEIAQLAAGQAQ